MSFEHIVGRFWVGPAHLWDKCRLWEGRVPHPSTLERARAGPHYSLSIHSEARRFIEAHLGRHDFPETQLMKNTEFFRVTLHNVIISEGHRDR